MSAERENQEEIKEIGESKTVETPEEPTTDIVIPNPTETEIPNPPAVEISQGLPPTPAPTIPELEHLIIDHRLQLSQIEILLEESENKSPQSPQTLNDLRTQDRTLRESLQIHQKALDRERALKSQVFSKQKVHKSSEGMACTGYFEADNKWYTAIIHTVNEIAQTLEITWVGYKEKATVPAKYVRVILPPLSEELSTGLYCEALYKEDGGWHPCVIEKVCDDGQYVVKYKKYSNRETIPIQFIRIPNATNTSSTTNKLKRATPEESVEFKAPEHLKAKASDTDAQKKQKKKKLKALKRNHRLKQIDADTNGKRSNWQNFTKEAGLKKRGYFYAKKGDSIFKSPDTIGGRVGVTGSGKGMTPFINKKKNVDDAEDDSSRLF